MAKPRRITIKEVALEARVSTQTVSRVLNQRPDVADETRKRVNEVIERLGYHPSSLARSLIQQRSYTLGVVTAGLKFIGPSRILNGITQQAEAMGYSLLLKELPRFDADNYDDLLMSLLSNHVDGIIWAVPDVGNNRNWLRERVPGLSVPVVFLSMETQPDISIISIDNYLGATLATQHLIDQGYQRIGHISGPLEWWDTQQRKAGWQDTLKKAGLQVADHQWVEGNWSSASGEKAFVQLRKQYPEMDAVFVANDQMALGVLNVACKERIQVPRDLGVVGFDGLSEAAYFFPPLSTVDQDLNQLGDVAVRKLVEAIEAGLRGEASTPEAILLKPDLIIRESSKKMESG